MAPETHLVPDEIRPTAGAAKILDCPSHLFQHCESTMQHGNNQTPHFLRSQKNPHHFSMSVFTAGKLLLLWRQWLVHANFLGVCGWVSWWWRASWLKHGLVDRERASNNNHNIYQLSLNHHHQHHQHSHHHPKQSVFIDLFVYYNYMPTLIAAIPYTGNP